MSAAKEQFKNVLFIMSKDKCENITEKEISEFADNL
jgi:hypothetical protein